MCNVLIKRFQHDTDDVSVFYCCLIARFTFALNCTYTFAIYCYKKCMYRYVFNHVVDVCSDLTQNPLIVPVKILRCHSSTLRNDVGVLDCEFHPTQPWILTCGVDNTLKLFT